MCASIFKRGYIYLRMLVIFLWIVFGLTLAGIVHLITPYPHPVALRLKMTLYKGAFFLLRGRITCQGTPSATWPTLYVANHVSFLDILVLGSLLPGGFVAKGEIARWPLIGKMATLHGTVFVNRQRTSVKNQITVVQRSLARGQSLILFPEGTSSSGTHVLPFKSSFLTLPQGSAIPIQPISISYPCRHGLPMGRMNKWFYAWFGDMDLLSALIYILDKGPFTAHVYFHPPLVGTTTCRKNLATTTHDIIQEGLSAAS